jgi:DNA-binding NtrC family response regulator
MDSSSIAAEETTTALSGSLLVRVAPSKRAVGLSPLAVVSSLQAFGRIAGVSPAMNDVFQVVRRVAPTEVAFVDAGVLEPHHVRFVSGAGDHALLERLALGGHTLASLEQAAIKQTLLLTHGNKVQAARTLGIAASTLYEKLKRYGI